MWDDRLLEVCRRHPDLVAVYESRHGRLGLLLRQTLAPLGVERVEWLAETRAIARAIIEDLRAARFSGGTVVLQWLRLEDVARIVGRWVRRWDGDPTRRSQLIATVERAVTDQLFIQSCAAARVSPAERAAAEEAAAATMRTLMPAGRALDDAGLEALKLWYESMASRWLAIRPAQRRRLVLQTHVWIAECALADPVMGPGIAVKDLGPDGPLARALTRLVTDDVTQWRHWIDLARLDLERALRRPPAERGQAWARALFMIPYRLPVPRRAGLRALPGAAAASRPA
jgi:hypothetical protein